MDEGDQRGPIVRGGPGDALARVRRWDEIRQRLASMSGGSQVIDDVVKAIGEVLQRHGQVQVTVTVDEGDRLSTVRMVRRDGQLTVTRLEPAVTQPPSTVVDGIPSPPPSWPVAR